MTNAEILEAFHKMEEDQLKMPKGADYRAICAAIARDAGRDAEDVHEVVLDGVLMGAV